MPQLYYQDSGGLIHQGLDAAVYQSTDPSLWSWDPTVHAIANSSQEFPENWEHHKVGAWIYVSVIGEFFRRKDDQHALLVAASSFFTAERWTEIEDVLDEMGNMTRLLRQGHFRKFRRKVTRAKNKTLLTAAEAQSIKSVVARFPNGI